MPRTGEPKRAVEKNVNHEHVRLRGSGGGRGLSVMPEELPHLAAGWIHTHGAAQGQLAAAGHSRL